MTGVGSQCSGDATVADGFDAAFAILKLEGLRNEYIYRTALTHKVLLGKHSLNTACMLTEFRAGDRKADLVILNGTATAYEIKSERDSLVRVVHQVTNYKKVFAKVNVIASETHLNGVLESVPEDVGVMCLSRRYRIRTVREAQDRPDRIDPLAVLDSLRFSEALSILEILGIQFPEIPNTKRYTAMQTIFSELDPTEIHLAMVTTLKKSRNLAPLSDLIDRLPSSLQAAALSIPVHRDEHNRLVNAVSTKLIDALSWA